MLDSSILPKMSEWRPKVNELAKEDTGNRDTVRYHDIQQFFFSFLVMRPGAYRMT